MVGNWSAARHRFFFNDAAAPEIYPLSLHDALPIDGERVALGRRAGFRPAGGRGDGEVLGAVLAGVEGERVELRRGAGPGAGAGGVGAGGETGRTEEGRGGEEG